MLRKVSIAALLIGQALASEAVTRPLGTQQMMEEELRRIDAQIQECQPGEQVSVNVNRQEILVDCDFVDALKEMMPNLFFLTDVFAANWEDIQQEAVLPDVAEPVVETIDVTDPEFDQGNQM